MKTREWGKPNLEINKEVMELDRIKVRRHLLTKDLPSMRTDYHPRAFVSIGRKYKKIAGKRFRLPRKVKKEYKKRMCKYGWDIKKIKISYKLLNRDVVGTQNIKWAYLQDKLNEYETAYGNKRKRNI